MNHKMYLEMNYFVKQKRVDGHKVSTTTDLVVYLDEQIGILSRHLDSGPFDCDLLPGLWRAAIVDMRLIMLNVTKNGKKVSGGSAKRANFLLQVYIVINVKPIYFGSVINIWFIIDNNRN